MKSHLFFDAHWGSVGKGLFTGYAALREKPDTVMSSFAANAGHVFQASDGTRYLNKMLPNGVISPKLERVLIGPGSAIDPERLLSEMDDYNFSHNLDPKQVFIHENAAVISKDNIKAEADLGRIGSTQTGVGAAYIQRMQRDPNNSNIARDVLKPYGLQVVTAEEYLEQVWKARVIQIESAQGFGLSLYHGSWPYVTSRDVTPLQVMADVGLPTDIGKITEVTGIFRTFPIRVNNKTGTSGPCYPDQHEISFEELGQQVELTTVTKLPRRVFTYSRRQVEHACAQCGFDNIALNFANYARSLEELMDILNHMVSLAPVKYVSFGPSEDDVIDLEWAMRNDVDPTALIATRYAQ